MNVPQNSVVDGILGDDIHYNLIDARRGGGRRRRCGENVTGAIIWRGWSCHGCATLYFRVKKLAEMNRGNIMTEHDTVIEIANVPQEGLAFGWAIHISLVEDPVPAVAAILKDEAVASIFRKVACALEQCR